MKTLIVYASEYGSTKTCANVLSEHIGGDVTLHDLKKGMISPAGYDSVVIGGSVYAGSVQKEVTGFCRENMPVLLQKKSGLYICCAAPSPKGDEYLNLYPEELFKSAKAKGAFGGEFNFSKMRRIHKAIIKLIIKANKELAAPALDMEAVRKFAAELQ